MTNPIPPNTHWLTFNGDITDAQMTALYQRKYTLPPRDIIRWQSYVYAGPIPSSNKQDNDIVYSQ